jgi:thiol-disulfide isomerase/thioredoxin
MNRIVAAAAVALFAAVVSAQDAPALKIGDAAPPLKVASWVKGKPIEKLDNGKVYVVEFWATWDVPSKMAVPLLTEIAKRYKGKVTFIGVSSFERKASDYEDAVPKFVKEMGDKMGYNVATDDGAGANGTMGKTWMTAAKQTTVPTAFVVGKDGTVQWIGHPLQEMDVVLDRILAGKFDAIAFDQARRKQQDATAPTRQGAPRAMLKPMDDAVRKGDWKGAVAALAAHPEMETPYAMTRINLIQHYDEEGMYAYMRKLAEGAFKDNLSGLKQMAHFIVDDKSPVKKRNYDVAIEVAQRGVEVSNEQDPAILDMLAVARFKKGDLDGAIESERKAVALLDKPDTGVTDEMKKDIRQRLAEYEKQKGG